MKKVYKLEMSNRAVDDHGDWIDCWCCWKTIAEYNSKEEAQASFNLIKDYDTEINGIKGMTRRYRVIESVEEEIVSTQKEADKLYYGDDDI